MATTVSGTLYDRIGGDVAVMAAVQRFYEKVLADPRVSGFFVDLDMGAQVRKQVAFITWALGGPAEYKGRDLRTAHARLVEHDGLSDVHFDAVAGILRETLEEMGVAPADVNEALSIIGAQRDEVLGR